eukprot:GHVT01073586.1.p1 GENE.GHVT01073586.1~~GHVT01073586.1.p1  ORF type:complete len:122 (+),score=13.85 GHVT01073586.1:757-1122(+)
MHFWLQTKHGRLLPILLRVGAVTVIGIPTGNKHGSQAADTTKPTYTCRKDVGAGDCKRRRTHRVMQSQTGSVNTGLDRVKCKKASAGDMEGWGTERNEKVPESKLQRPASIISKGLEASES